MPPPTKRRKTSTTATTPTISTETTTSTDQTTSTEPTTSKNAMDAYPGFDPWNATLDIQTGDKKMSIFDSTKAQFTHTAKIYDSDAFKLKPLTIADGALKGRHVIMLEPINDFFRFLDMPPEIRNIVYDILLQEPEDVGVEVFRSRYSRSRAVREGFQRQSLHKDTTWNATKSNWNDRTPSAHAILRVCKQINTEAAAVAYGSNHFTFEGLPDLKVFLGDIGTMRRFLKHVSFGSVQYHNSLATPVFHKLKDAEGLRSLTFCHGTVCQDRSQYARWYKPTSLDKIVADVKPLTKALHKAQKSSDNPISVLDIVKISCSPEAHDCKAGQGNERCEHKAAPDAVCIKQQCHEWRSHAQETQAVFRKKLADALRIEEQT